LMIAGVSDARSIVADNKAIQEETFCELHFIWSTNLDWAYLQYVRPDIVISEEAERFMCLMPTDRFELSVYVANRLGQLPSPLLIPA
jgi:hypothetical protein